MDRARSTHGKNRNACRILVEKSEGKRPLGGRRCRREDNFKMGLREIERGGGYGLDSSGSE
jgi:hypothetical protein